MSGGKTTNLIGTGRAARILGVSSKTVIEWGDKGELSYTDSSIGRLYDEEVIRALAKQREREASK